MRTLRNSARTLTAFVAFGLTAGCSSDEQDPTDPVDAGFADSGEHMNPADSGVMAVNCAERPVDNPPLRSEATLVYDGPRDRLIMFGGNVAVAMCPSITRTPSADIWAFELDCNNWRQLTPASAPPARTRHMVTVDTVRNRMIVFGGRAGMPGAYTFFNDVWAFDLATETWSEVATAGQAPPARDYGVISYDATRDRVVVFGGDNDPTGFLNSALDDYWSLDMSTGLWTRLGPNGGQPAPPATLYHAAATFGDSMLVFGGAEDFSVYRNDLWSFDFATNMWSQIFAGGAGAPRNRFGPALFADPSQGRAIAFAGHDDLALGNRNDTWGVLIGNGGWARLSAGDEAIHSAPSPRPDSRRDRAAATIHPPSRSRRGSRRRAVVPWPPRSCLPGPSRC